MVLLTMSVPCVITCEAYMCTAHVLFVNKQSGLRLQEQCCCHGCRSGSNNNSVNWICHATLGASARLEVLDMHRVNLACVYSQTCLLAQQSGSGLHFGS